MAKVGTAVFLFVTVHATQEIIIDPKNGIAR
jgi:hypothetical protein